ncbi:hypothetical protein BFC18_15755 [Alteromonas confluentis]|uniref:Uncharacterized protein n=1 Tax=Alteromonas confluentis TaxID=1656094 RepID=A0A1E7Z9A6_9ALTE|nr:hypothetical protein BFC18_15755 [Alteromonas confluentis]
MGFSRFESHQHVVAGNKLDVIYDRFTTKIELKVNRAILYSKHIWFWPRHNAFIQIGAEDYRLSVYKLLIWSAKLKKDNNSVVEELLPRRRRRSISVLGYCALTILARALSVAISA